MFTAKSIAALLLTGATICAVPALGRANSADPCAGTSGVQCYDSVNGYTGGCFYSPLCGCYCNGALWWETDCSPSGVAYCQPTGTPEK